MINGEPGGPTGTVQLTDGSPCDDINHPPGCQMFPNDVRLPEALLAAGASVEQKDSRGFTVLTGQTAFVRLLLDAGPRPGPAGQGSAERGGPCRQDTEQGAVCRARDRNGNGAGRHGDFTLSDGCCILPPDQPARHLTVVRMAAPRASYRGP